MYKQSIGLVGGFGGYATLDFYKKLLEEFGTGYERDYPRICMDNNFTMPSRTKALLEDSKEDIETIVNSISDSIKWLIQGGCDHIILVCGTAHSFLPLVLSKHPEYKNHILNIIEITRDYLSDNEINKVLVIAAEGALKKRVYNSYFEERGIETILPAEKDYQTIRSFIEAVKQNKIDRSIGTSFIDFLNSYNTDCIILGCTEFPALISALTEYEDIKEALGRFRFINPLQQTIETLKQIMI